MDFFKWSGSDVGGFDHEPAAWHASLPYVTHGGRTQVMVPSGSTVRYLGKSPLGSPAVLYHRMYVTFPTNLTSGSNVIARSLTSENQQAWRLRRGPNGTVIIDGPTNSLSTSAALGAGTEWRLEWRTSATDLQLRIYDGESTTPFDTRTATASFLLGDNTQFGQLLGSPALPTFYMRDLLITDDGWTGPSPEPEAVASPRIAIVGDSLTAQSGANGRYIFDEMVSRGMPTRNTYLWGVGGKRISVADTSNNGNNGNNKTTMQNMDDAMVQLGGVDHWLICLGTNDRPYTSSEVNGYIDTVLAKVDALSPDTKVTWLSITSKISASTDDVRLNGLIAAKIAARPNSVYADWDAHIRAIDDGVVLPWWLPTSDTVHMSATGYPVRAAYQVDQVQAPATTGTVTQTMPALISDADGSTAPPAFVGTAAATLPMLGQASAGTINPPTFVGVVNAVFPALTGTATGDATSPGTVGSVEAILPALSSALSGSTTPPAFAGTVASAMPSLVVAAVGAVTAPATASGRVATELPALTASAVGTVGGRATRMVFTPTAHRPSGPVTSPRRLPAPVWPPT